MNAITNDTEDEKTTIDKWGVILIRAQPINFSHLNLINRAYQTHEKVLLVIGSANKKNEKRNPFSIKLRKRLLLPALEDYFGSSYSKKISVMTLNDYSDEDDSDVYSWGNYLYYNIISQIDSHHFTFYYFDDPSIMLSWFSLDLQKKISFSFIPRKQLGDISSTKVRKALLDNDTAYLSASCPYTVMKKRVTLQKILQKIELLEEDVS